jgi:hypothetical protein
MESDPANIHRNIAMHVQFLASRTDGLKLSGSRLQIGDTLHFGHEFALRIYERVM